MVTSSDDFRDSDMHIKITEPSFIFKTRSVVFGGHWDAGAYTTTVGQRRLHVGQFVSPSQGHIFTPKRLFRVTN